jgi:hypothetical protein
LAKQFRFLSANRVSVVSQTVRKDSQRTSVIHVDAWASYQEGIPDLPEDLRQQVDKSVRSDFDFLQDAIEETDFMRGLILYQYYFDKHAATITV